MLDHLGMAELADADTGRLSGGQAKRVALARTLVADSDLLVLDEPTNHLDIDAIAWLEERLAAYRGGLLLVTHDRHLLDRVTTRVLELDRGRGYVHDGGYDVYLEGRAEREEQAAATESTRRILARKELAWLRRGAPARTRKPKARIESATAIVESRAEPAARQGIPDLWFGTPRLGDKVVELHDVAFAHPGADPLFDGVELLLDPRERLGLVGPNGVGKSTLLDLIAGRREPTEGEVDTGPTVRMGYYDQVGVTLDPSQRVRDAVTGGHRQPDWQDAALLESFWFDTDAQWAPIGLLSGGERRRLQLLLVLADQAQRAPARRAHQRSRHRHPARPRGVPRRLARRPRGGQPRPGLPRTHRHRRDGDGRRAPPGPATRGVRGVGGRPPGEPGQGSGHQHPLPTSAETGPDEGQAPARHKPPRRRTPSAPRSPSTLRRLMKDADKEVVRLGRRRVVLEEALAEKAATADHTELTALGAELAQLVASLEAAEEQLAGPRGGGGGRRAGSPPRRPVD